MVHLITNNNKYDCTKYNNNNQVLLFKCIKCNKVGTCEEMNNPSANHNTVFFKRSVRPCYTNNKVSYHILSKDIMIREYREDLSSYTIIPKSQDNITIKVPKNYTGTITFTN